MTWRLRLLPGNDIVLDLSYISLIFLDISATAACRFNHDIYPHVRLTLLILLFPWKKCFSTWFFSRKKNQEKLLSIQLNSWQRLMSSYTYAAPGIGRGLLESATGAADWWLSEVVGKSSMPEMSPPCKGNSPIQVCTQSSHKIYLCYPYTPHIQGKNNSLSRHLSTSPHSSYCQFLFLPF